MISHAPPGYVCPICALVAGGTTDVSGQQDIVWQSERATAFICARWWPNNHGHVLVVPNAHHENIYDLPAEYGHAVHDGVRTIARAIRDTYGCEGISTRQHNEPAGYQDTWHYHVHVFPRYRGDDLYGSKPYPAFVSAERRRPYADKLRTHLRHPGE
ncbi:HIT family protein [Actinopolymorpha sp. B9G3]|uniref:HIT family protein n=1 Tax=Actinopolymorpha sp. B9G3 TaxID=3158970 RepID=UPI0032D94626